MGLIEDIKEQVDRGFEETSKVKNKSEKKLGEPLDWNTDAEEPIYLDEKRKRKNERLDRNEETELLRKRKEDFEEDDLTKITKSPHLHEEGINDSPLTKVVNGKKVLYLPEFDLEEDMVGFWRHKWPSKHLGKFGMKWQVKGAMEPIVYRPTKEELKQPGRSNVELKPANSPELANKTHQAYALERIKEQIDESDVIVFGRTNNNFLRDVFEYAKATGKVVGYEFDDLLIGKHGFFREPGKHGEKSLGDYIEEQVKGADFVTVTTPYLKEVVAKSRGNNKNIYIIKNRLPLDVIGKYMPKIKKAKEKGEIRIGWAGGKYHFGNVFAMREVMKKLHDKYGDRLTFVFKGFNSENMLNPNEKKALSEFENFFKKNSIKYELHGYTPFSKGWENYYKELGKLNLDIFFSPAVEFNPENPEYWQHEAKSELKYLEAAFIGAPIVTPAIGGHKHEVKHMKTGMLVNPKNREEGFYRSLDYLIANPEEREYIARAARKDLIEKRDAEISSTELATVFAEQIQRKKGKPMEEVLMEEAA